MIPVQAAHFQSARYHLRQRVELDGFQHVVDGAALHRLYRQTGSWHDRFAVRR